MNKTYWKKDIAPSTFKKQKSGALHLTQKIDYGIVLLATLAKKNSKSLKKISEEKSLAFPFLQKIASALLQAKLIKAERGKYGGYTLAKSPNKISLKEIIEALEGPIAIMTCLSHPCGRNAKCKVKSNFKKINDELIKFFSSKKLDKIIK